MVEYEKMYAVLCGAVDTALELIEQNSGTRQVAETLQVALNKAESMYIEGQGAQHRSARQKRFCRSFDTGLPQKLYPQQHQFASKLPDSYISAVRATTGAVSHRRMRAPMAQMCMPTLRAMSAS